MQFYSIYSRLSSIRDQRMWFLKDGLYCFSTLIEIFAIMQKIIENWRNFTLCNEIIVFNISYQSFYCLQNTELSQYYPMVEMILRRRLQPIKFMTTICKMMWANMKSANPLSGLIPWNWLLFWGFTCNRRHTIKKRFSLVIYVGDSIPRNIESAGSKSYKFWKLNLAKNVFYFKNQY